MCTRRKPHKTQNSWKSVIVFSDFSSLNFIKTSLKSKYLTVKISVVSNSHFEFLERTNRLEEVVKICCQIYNTRESVLTKFFLILAKILDPKLSPKKSFVGPENLKKSRQKLVNSNKSKKIRVKLHFWQF